MIVLALMAIASAIVYVSLRAVLPGQTLRSAARQLASTIALARSQAIVEGRTMLVRYSSDPAACRVLRRRAEDEQRPEERTLWTVRLPPEITLEVRVGGASARAGGPRGDVLCTPVGAITPHDVILRNSGGSRVSLKVHPLTGRVQFGEEAD